MQNNTSNPLSSADEEALKRNLGAVLGRFSRAVERAGRKGGDVQLVAISKWHGLEKIIAVARYWKSLGGNPVFGENYVQEALAKQNSALEAGEHGLNWHFTGHLQSNKAKQAAGRFELFHALDSLTLARNLQKSLQQGVDAVKNTPAPLSQPVLVQVNIGLEASKSGLEPDKLESFLIELQGVELVQVQGLMILPPFSDDPEATRPYFSRLRQMCDSMESRLGIKLPHLSMGMSSDFEAAIEEGATLVRVGTDIFGQRQY